MASSIDVERGRDEPVRRLEGFPTLADFISQDNDAEIYRRFNRLGARNLLHLQSVVARLEKKLNDLDREDFENAAGNPGLRMAAKGGGGEDEMEREKLQDQIAVAMNNYREFDPDLECVDFRELMK